MKYAVTAASGQLGRLVLDDLLAHVPPSEVVAVVRTPGKLAELARAGVDVRAGDYDDPEAWATAFEGVDAALVISGWDVGRRVEQHERVLGAARRAGVERVAYTSTVDWGFENPVTREHQETERLLQESGPGWIVLRDHLYVEPYEIEVEIAARTGSYRTTVKGAGSAFVTRGDVARCASAVLRGPGHRDTVFTLSGPGAATPDDFAAVAAELRGAPVAVEHVTRDTLRADYLARGMDAHMVELSLQLEDAIQSGALAAATADVERLLGRPGTSFRAHMLTAVGPRLAAAT